MPRPIAFNLIKPSWRPSKRLKVATAWQWNSEDGGCLSLPRSLPLATPPPLRWETLHGTARVTLFCFLRLSTHRTSGKMARLAFICLALVATSVLVAANLDPSWQDTETTTKWGSLLPYFFKDVHLTAFVVAEMKPRMVDGSVNHSTPPRRLGELPSPLHLVCVQAHECLLPRDGRGTLSCSQPKGGGLGKRQERADPLSDGSCRVRQ
jgi:hypothetical protein